MPDEMNIETALAKLEAGKFSFNMVEAISNHIEKLERELEVMRNLHATALRDLQSKEYASWKLESEVKKLKLRIRLILRANLFIEKARRRMNPVAVAAGEYFGALWKLVEKMLDRALDGLKSGRYQAQLIRASSELYVLLKANLPTEEEARLKMQGLATKMIQNFRVLRRHTAGGATWAAAYLSNLRRASGQTGKK